ncbi:transglycosylase SLT domain-containing protein [Candidatus Pacearchaeota archaeon]|nr:hypothetical protein [uncultured archaeon]AQS28876.1 hypothetical protein [uncultured archaeon]MBS3077672.1 transglycosylase SLT domain-containing protein [Candidatus Pacearchaeota archaeon]
MEVQPTRRELLKEFMLGGVLTAIGVGSLIAYAEASAKPSANAQPKHQNPIAPTPRQTYTRKDCIDAIIQIESGGNPLATRWEEHLGEYSYGLGEILGSTAREIEQKYPQLPRLGKTKLELESNLFNPKINRAYTEAHYDDQYDLYQDPFLAVAGYNAGHFMPRNARTMQQLGMLFKQHVLPNGNFSKNRRARTLLKKFQRENHLDVDGIMGPQSYETLQVAWTRRFPTSQNIFAIIPENGTTPHHVEKFRAALTQIVQNREHYA